MKSLQQKLIVMLLQVSLQPTVCARTQQRPYLAPRFIQVRTHANGNSPPPPPIIFPFPLQCWPLSAACWTSFHGDIVWPSFYSNVEWPTTDCSVDWPSFDGNGDTPSVYDDNRPSNHESIYWPSFHDQVDWPTFTTTRQAFTTT